ncbi:N-methyl-L-tryptophan oxidase [Methylocystis parvus]|nr:N-methyl-L-tryptophan oxidase [Methylocystis parvus]WBJ99330.1 N-methyl-L-tryptophan oxidase [Methylocystis parvus OBBP]
MSGAYDVIVIGLGAMGSSACYHLAARGHRVLGLDQYHLAHDRGSSHGETRLIRKAYFENPSYVPLLRRAYELWENLELECGRTLFERAGLVTFGRPGASRVFDGARASGRLYDIPLEEFSREQAIGRWPIYRPPEGFAAAFEPGAGFLYAERCVLAHANEARKRGAELRENEPVVDFAIENRQAVVRTACGRYTAARLIVAGGGWSASLLRELVLPLTLRKMMLGWFPATSDHAAEKGAPGFVFDLDDDFYYGFPQIDGESIKVAGHRRFEPLAAPEDKDRLPPSAQRIAPLRQFVRDCLPFAQDEMLRTSHCIYTMTPDEDFIIDRHPTAPELVFAAGFSGHGFKFASVVGEILADLAIEGETAQPISFLSAARFSA